MRTKELVQWRGGSRKQWLAMPSEDHDVKWEWVRLPKDIYTSKQYPTCTCGKKYVPIRGSTQCYWCSKQSS